MSEPTRPPATETAPEVAQHAGADRQELPAFTNPWDPFHAAPQEPARQNGAAEAVLPQEKPTVVFPAAAEGTEVAVTIAPAR